MTAQPFAGLAPREADALRALGPRWADDIETHRRQVVEIYTPHLARACREGILVDTGLAYGAHPRQRLDLYRSAATPARGAPMAVFVHGGAFVRGSMNSNAEIYGNVTRWLARQGWLAANVEYRLAPEARYPEGARDVGLALDWLRRHAEDYGGDPRCVVLIGHSAGGAHVAGYAIDPATCPTSGRGPEPESNRQPETARRSAPERASERAPERAPAPVPEPAHWPASSAPAHDRLGGLVLKSATLGADPTTPKPHAHGGWGGSGACTLRGAGAGVRGAGPGRPGRSRADQRQAAGRRQDAQPQRTRRARLLGGRRVAL